MGKPVAKWEEYWKSFEFTLSHKVYLELASTHISEMLETSGLRRAYLLDVGCGSGYLDILLARKTGFRIIGVDIVGEALKLGEKMVRDAGFEHRINFVRGSVFDLPFRDNSFDAAISTGHESAGAFPGGTEEVSRTVKMGGEMIFDFVKMPNLYQPVSSIWRYFQYKREARMVKNGAKWEGPLKHYHYGVLGLKEHFEDNLGLKITEIRHIFTSPPIISKHARWKFENSIGKYFARLLARVLLVKLKNTKGGAHGYRISQ